MSVCSPELIDGELQAACYHEAGHAVLADVLRHVTHQSVVYVEVTQHNHYSRVTGHEKYYGGLAKFQAVPLAVMQQLLELDDGVPLTEATAQILEARIVTTLAGPIAMTMLNEWSEVDGSYPGCYEEDLMDAGGGFPEDPGTDMHSVQSWLEQLSTESDVQDRYRQDLTQRTLLLLDRHWNAVKLVADLLATHRFLDWDEHCDAVRAAALR